MRVVVTGATGFVGRAVVRVLQREGYRVAAFTRRPDEARGILGADVELVSDDAGLVAAVEGASGVVNLAGEPILPGRWSNAKKERILASRVGTTRRVVGAIRAAKQRPAVLVSASGVGAYGSRVDDPCDEDRPVADGFLGEVTRAWEGAAVEARALGVRVALLRIGIVLGPEEGALATMAPLFRWGVGGPLGDGSQPMPWIHVDDLAGIVARALSDARLDGPVNAVTDVVPQGQFAREIGRTLGRPAVIPPPSPAVRVAFGEAADAVLGGQNAVPSRLRAAGFRWKFPDLGAALADCLVDPTIAFGPARDVPDSVYLRARPPRRQLVQRVVLRGARADVVPFFERPENLGLITPPLMNFGIRTPSPIEMKLGAVIDYTIRVGALPFTWRTVMEAWEPGRQFVDAAHKGPYASWWHEHTFDDAPGGTSMQDRVWFASPLGPLGRVADVLYVEPTLRRIFSYRRVAVRQRFGFVA